jgi:hypothetical protein
MKIFSAFVLRMTGLIEIVLYHNIRFTERIIYKKDEDEERRGKR